MAGAVHRASLLVQMLFYHVRLNIIQETGKWIRTHTQRKAKVKTLTKKFSVEDDDFFDIGASVVGEQSATSDRCDEGKEDDFTYHSDKHAGKSSGQKMKQRFGFRKNKVTPSERQAWNGNGKDNDKKRRHSHSISLFGSRSTKASNIKSDFDKPYRKDTKC